MADTFIINLPYHKRWWLPCRCHQYNSVLHGDTFHCSIIDLRGETLSSWDIKITKDWENLSLLSQELANKNHPRRTGRMSNCRVVPHHVQTDARRNYLASKRS